MTTYTREKLHQMFLDNERFRLQQVINTATNDIKLDIIDKNRQGYKKYTMEFTENKERMTINLRYLKECPFILNESIRKLKEIFVDTEFNTEKKDDITYLTIDWSI
jgi:hypothetical protein